MGRECESGESVCVSGERMSGRESVSWERERVRVGRENEWGGERECEWG